MRKAEVKRKTKETDIYAELNIDGKGNYDIATGIGFLTTCFLYLPSMDFLI